MKIDFGFLMLFESPGETKTNGEQIRSKALFVLELFNFKNSIVTSFSPKDRFAYVNTR